jgi:hypothetical protein
MSSLKVTAALEAALVDALVAFGAASSLPSLRWEIIDYPEGLVFEGRPAVGEPVSAADCERWAEQLGMKEYRWDSGDGVRSWYVDDGHWRFELRSS